MQNLRALVFFALLSACLSSSGAVLYSNTDARFTCCASGSDFAFPLQIADGFSISAPSDVIITSVYWTGWYSPAEIAAEDNFTIRFFADDGGRPQVDPIVSIPIGDNLSRNPWGGGDFSFLAIIEPVRLSAFTPYFISIIADTTGSASNWFWYAEDFPPGATRIDRVSDGDAWAGNGLRNYVFVLSGEIAPVQEVPEPTTALLVSVALVGLSLTRRRKQ